MTSKLPMYYALVSDYSGYRIVAVTTEKRTQIYGSVNGEATHCRISDIKARFSSMEAALEKLNDIKAVIQVYRIKYKMLNEEMNALHRAEYQEIEAIVKRKQDEPAK